MSKGGVEVCTLVGCNLALVRPDFIEPSVVKLDYGKMSASDLSSLEIALWYLELQEMIEISTCESERIYTELKLFWIQIEALFSFETVDECFQKHSLDSWVRMSGFIDLGDGIGISVSIPDVASYIWDVCEAYWLPLASMRDTPALWGQCLRILFDLWVFDLGVYFVTFVAVTFGWHLVIAVSELL